MFLFFVFLLILYLAVNIIYRLYLHPLASFRGPKLAASTGLYCAYHDILGTGVIKLLPELHKKYGPIVRLRPNELHVADLESYNQIYRVGTPFTRIWHHNPFLTGPFFFKAAISRAEPDLHGKKLRLFLAALTSAKDTAVDFHLAFHCLTADVVMDYCFQSDLNTISSPEFRNKTLERVIEGADMAVTSTYFPNFFAVLNKVIFALPEHIREKHFGPIYGCQTMQNVAREKVEAAIERAAEGGNSKEKKEAGSLGRTMFDAMAQPDVSKGQVAPPKSDMVAEGALMFLAGMDTTANALGNILWYITQNPSLEQKLVAELKGRIGKDDVLESASLEGEGFEYMRAIVKEGLRLSYGVPGRILRRAPAEGTTMSGRFVPGGTIITSGIYLQNTDPETFPDPFRFDPERWLCDAETYKRRDRQMLSFSRGSRSCIGLNLAIATLHLTVAHMFRRFKIETTGYTTEGDMEWNDRFIPVPNGHIKGLVKLREE